MAAARWLSAASLRRTLEQWDSGAELKELQEVWTSQTTLLIVEERKMRQRVLAPSGGFVSAVEQILRAQLSFFPSFSPEFAACCKTKWCK